MFYTTPGLNRQAEHRKDPKLLADALANPNTQIFAIWRSRSLINETSEAVSVDPSFVTDDRQVAYLGDTLGGPVIAVDLSDLDLDPESPGAKLPGQFAELRPHAANMDMLEAGMLTYAQSLFSWHRATKFCGNCGGETKSIDSGHVRQCTNEDCGRHHFTRLNPAVIMAVVCGRHIVLARNVAWANSPRAKMRSVLAGFVELGECLEDAVAREVMEEVNVAVDRVTYVASQPWPYTNSLMLAYHAEVDAVDGKLPEITIDDEELTEADWMTPDDIRAGLADGSLGIPPTDAVARILIDRWLEQLGETL